MLCSEKAKEKREKPQYAAAGGVMKKRVVKLYLGEDAVLSRKRPVMAPGEMEELKLTKQMLDAHPGLTRIHITVEEA